MAELLALDRDAARALALVDDEPASQIAALAALELLIDACPSDGALRAEAMRLRDERRASFRRFHLERAARISLQTRARALATVHDAIALVSHLDGASESGDLRALRVRLVALERGDSGDAVPFFARYLTPQR
jgi:hypothetical protein